MKPLITLFVLGSVLFSCKTDQAVKKNAVAETEAVPSLSLLNGAWQLNYISDLRIAFEGLYPERKPEITFDTANKRVSGNTSCNSFNGPLNADDTRISFTEPMVMTKMMCQGEGESRFLETLKTVNRYSVTDENQTLNLISGDIAVLRFTRKP